MVPATSPEHPGQGGAVDGDRGRQAGDHAPRPRRPSSAAGPSRVARDSAAGPASARRLQALLDAVDLARRRAAPRRSGRSAPGAAGSSSSGRASSHRRSASSSRSRRIAGMASSTRSAARSKSPPAIAWRIASAALAFRSYHSAARRWRSGTSSGPLVQQAGQQDVAEQVVVAVPRRRSSSGMRNRFPRSSASSVALPPAWPVTASHSGPHMRARIEVCEQEAPDVLGLTLPGPPRRGSRRCSGRRRRSRR